MTRRSCRPRPLARSGMCGCSAGTGWCAATARTLLQSGRRRSVCEDRWRIRSRTCQPGIVLGAVHDAARRLRRCRCAASWTAPARDARFALGRGKGMVPAIEQENDHSVAQSTARLPSVGKALRRPVEPGQYVCIRYTERLAEAGIEPSVGSVGDSYDNALAESINGLYKTEVIRRCGPWRSLEAVEFATLEWVEWFNNRRLLEPIGNMPPAEAEARYYADLETLPIAA